MYDKNKAHYVVVTGILVKNGKYLITKRADWEKAFPGRWTVPGGKLEALDYTLREKDTTHHWYNVIEAALIREVKEEVGLDIEIFSKDIPLFNLKDYKELIPPKFLDRHRINPNHEHVVLVYFAKSFTDKIKQSEDELSEECKWFTKEEIDNPSYGIKEDIRFYAKKALEELGVKD